MSGWHDSAACLGHDPELWFPVSTGDRYPAAAAICGSCPVRTPCLQHALSKPEHYGLWGGYTPEQRASLRRRDQRRAARA